MFYVKRDITSFIFLNELQQNYKKKEQRLTRQEVRKSLKR